MISLQRLALDALTNACIEAFDGDIDHLTPVIQSAAASEPRMPPFPKHLSATQSRDAFAEFTAPVINETFYAGEVSNTLTTLKGSRMFREQITVRKIMDLTAFRSLAGRRLIMKMADDAARVPVPAQHRRSHASEWGWGKVSLYFADLRAIAGLAANSFAFHPTEPCVTVTQADVEAILPVLMNGKPTMTRPLKRKRAPGAYGE